MALLSKSGLATITICTGLVIASGTSGAVAGAMITGKQIKNNTITTKDIKDGTLRTVDMSADVLTALQRSGPTGPAGAPGSPGAPGLPGLSGYEVVTATTAVAAGDYGTVLRYCPDGKKALGGGGYWVNGTSIPLQVTPINNGTSENAWSAWGTNTLGADNTIVLSVVCATVS